MAHSRSFLANQKARNAIVGVENLLKSDICPWTLSRKQFASQKLTEHIFGRLSVIEHFHRYLYESNKYSFNVGDHITVVSTELRKLLPATITQEPFWGDALTHGGN